MHGLLKRAWRTNGESSQLDSSIPGFPPTCPKDVLKAPTHYNEA
jgi:hypothetical protein